MDAASVRVGLRVRPLTEKEVSNKCTECLTVIPNEPQVLLGTDKSFTYDYVFDTKANQPQVYSTAAAPLLHKFLDGYNATIFAYGQTGSGKTFSMGTGLDNSISAENEGIVPRCIIELFQTLKSREAKEDEYKYEVYVSFLELYNEEFVDLLNSPMQWKRRSLTNHAPAATSDVCIREDIAGNIYWSGVKEEACQNAEEVLSLLAQGSLSRTTGSTDMNSVSSRSHAIFSVILKQQTPDRDEAGNKTIKSLSSKFHFVDLAGSERLSRTNAQGERAKEGIAINSGLLALGNVISALGDETRRATHIPYRDSKLTRLLQDSLGGNSQTLMLACVSPAHTNFMETLSTLKYANRAKNIKNRVTINQDFAGSSLEVNQLKALVSRLRMEIASLQTVDRRHAGTASLLFDKEDGQALREEVKQLRERLKDMSDQIVRVTSERDTLLIERELGEFMQDDISDDDKLFQSIGATKKIEISPVIENYLSKIQKLTNELNDSNNKLKTMETEYQTLQKTLKRQQEQQQQALIANTVLQKFSNIGQQPQPKHNNSGRRRIAIVRNSSVGNSSSNNYHAVRITTKKNIKRQVIINKSSSTSSRTSSRKHKKKIAAHKHPKSNQQKVAAAEVQDYYEDEGFVNDLQDGGVHHEEVKESIAKVRADIRRSLEVLELVKPLDDTAASWEQELKSFEAEEATCKQMQRIPSDEGRFSLSPSPVEEVQKDKIETLNTPSWTGDEDDVSNGHGVLDLAAIAYNKENTSMAADERCKYSNQLSRMLHQIQSDIKVKEELVSHLEKSETEYSFMRKKFDEKIIQLQAQLAETQKEKEVAMTRARSGSFTRPDGTSNLQQLRASDKQQADLRQSYEIKIKNLQTEMYELRRKYNNVTSAMQSTRNQNESLLRTLKGNIETLKVEKKRLAHRMKTEAERVREQLSQQERKIQQLQRQHAKSNQARRRLEREHEQQKLVLKKRNEEVILGANQLKQLISIMKKAVREGGLLDDRLLNKIAPIMGGTFAVIARGGGHGFPKRTIRKKNRIPLNIRVLRKKELLDKALYQYIQGKQAIVEMEQLLIRREQLVDERNELEDERNQVYNVEKEHEETTGQPMDMIAVELMDDKIELLSAEISYLSARIQTLQTEAAVDSHEHKSKNQQKLTKHVTFVDDIINNDETQNDEWTDIDAYEDQFSVPLNAAPEVAYDTASKLIKSLENDECKRIMETLIDDIMELRMNEHGRQAVVQNLEKTLTDLRRALITMKKTAYSSTTDSLLSVNEDSAIAMMIQDSNDIISIASSSRKNSMAFDNLNADCITNDNNMIQHISLPNSPVISPPSDKTTFLPCSSGNFATTTKAPIPAYLNEHLNKHMTLSRESTPSPDRFFNMVQKKISWQQQYDERLDIGEELLKPKTIETTEFRHYASDHESSTSSIRSNHFRRSSIQSDMSSLSSWTHRTIDRNTMNSSVQHTEKPISHSIAAHIPALNMYTNFTPFKQSLLHSHSSANHLYQAHPMSRRPLPAVVTSNSTIDRSITPTVFDRLSQTPTRSSRAKMNFRYSSSSVDDLRKRWELEQQSANIPRARVSPT
ncbi:hypothetical protein BDF20DRAFT_916175 [Mycotypha africana]|uniref:uncharacterized protein n=1 Tax=Mycotypha africana TaxID=64632 RepID=UPI002301FBEB|nr:uncharacterized protein BDF20DRAFT_916175 [Mycotypha africana]KAI8970363.1 hypothetical protein BDF20DRAFT_916175 [Mycotypha africana]